MKAFVPLSDELLYGHPEQLPLELVPYQVGLPLSNRGRDPLPNSCRFESDQRNKKGSAPFSACHED